MGAGLIVAGASVASGLIGAAVQGEGMLAQASLYDEKARSYEINAEKVKIQAKADSAIMNTSYNELMANNAVMAAAQGRQFSGSVEAVAQASEASYNWDRDFSKLSAEYEIYGNKIQAAESRKAAQTTRRTAQASFAVGLLSTAAKASQVG